MTQTTQKILTAILSGLLPLVATAGQPTHHATPSILTEHSRIVAGSTVRVLVTFKIDPTWHLYWDGLNDTGQPPRFTWSLPKGWTISEPQFPVPHRNVQPGGIVDYIYEKSLTMGFALTVPKDDQPKTAVVSAAIDWLECSDRCMFGAGEVKTEFEVQTAPASNNQTTDTKTTDILKEFDSHLPRPFAQAKDLTLEVKDNKAVFEAKTAIQLQYFPGRTSSTPKDSVIGTVASGGSLSVEFDLKNGEPIVDGIIAVYRTKGGPADYYQVSQVPKPKATEPQASPIK